MLDYYFSHISGKRVEEKTLFICISKRAVETLLTGFCEQLQKVLP